MSRPALDALVRAALIATLCAGLGLAAIGCGPDTPEGTTRDLRKEGRAGIVTMEGSERFTDGKWVKHGAFTFRDDRGGVVAVGSYAAGLETGPWEETYEDGSVGRGGYLKGERSGEWSTYHPNQERTLQDRGRYEKGLRVGTWISFRADQTKLREAEYANGKTNGRVVYFGPDGRSVDVERSGTYRDGERKGPLPR